MEEFMQLFVDFGALKELKPEDEKVQNQVRELQDYITKNFYKCSNEILLSLGKMYVGGGDFTTNIDSVAGKGTAVFVAKAIELYVTTQS